MTKFDYFCAILQSDMFVHNCYYKYVIGARIVHFAENK